MQLPRRVPWESLAELEQVCSWIYTDENDLEAKQHAVNRVIAFRTGCTWHNLSDCVHYYSWPHGGLPYPSLMHSSLHTPF